MNGNDVFLSELKRQFACGLPSLSSVAVTEKDDMPLVRRLNALVPVTMAECGGCRFLSCFPSLKTKMTAFADRYGDALFSDMSLDALHAQLTPELLAWGYRPSAFPRKYAVCRMLDRLECVSFHNSREDIVRLTEPLAERLANKTSMKLSDCAKRGAYVCIVKQTVVAIAAVNQSFGASLCEEIGVECAPDYRGEGRGSACVASLTRQILSDGRVALYRHYITNRASAALAEAVGFTVCGSYFAYTAFSRG